MLLLSCMTGTSFDAFDVVVADVDIEGDALTLRPQGFVSSPIPTPLRDAIAAILPPGQCGVGDVCRVDAELGQAAGRVLAAAARDLPGDPEAVVWSGQTVHHWVEDGKVKGTLQIGRSAYIAETTGLPVISDLRARDVACGGQGAPLVAMVDVLLLADQLCRERRAVAALNLGGIGNLTVLAPGRPPVAYDVGPANALIDAAAWVASRGSARCDNDGAMAAAGTPSEELLARLLDDPYLAEGPPKTTGKERYNREFLHNACTGLQVAPSDLLATVTVHAAEVVAREAERHRLARLLVSGGGIRNPVLMRGIRNRLPGVEVVSTDAIGVAPEAKEALAFAVLGFLTWHGMAGNLPSCTGAGRDAVLGTLTPGAEPLVLPRPVRRTPRRLVVRPM